MTKKRILFHGRNLPRLYWYHHLACTVPFVELHLQKTYSQQNYPETSSTKQERTSRNHRIL